ncbi:VCBS repeat-containing protein [Fulvivirgaceae bacterium BMA12]|uniref:VCBS repeat-containing protein n=1 Tax=Agaribacillus aureus TaxID=3051825 RepID=A0ABT8LBM6_9BACT|nr:VCBS repeat-containing protein [Fulvivirgaceae bacterium BMA12]
MKKKVLVVLTIICWLVACNPKGEEKQSIPAIAEAGPLFDIIPTSQNGISFRNTLPENERMNSIFYEYYYNGGGVAVGDLDGDQLPELFFTGNVTPNKLYKNLGNLKFRDITDEAGLTDSPSWTTGTTMVDINNDGILDIYVCRSGKLKKEQRANLFFISTGMVDGIPQYTEKAKELGLADPGYATQALFFDFDLDNDLDMFLLNHNVEVRPFYDLDKIRNSRDPYVGDKLFRNDAPIKPSSKKENAVVFKDISSDAGIIGHELGYGLGVSAGDLNNDGWPDLYIANDYSEHDYLYINNGDGTFSEHLKHATGHISNYSMGTDIADINNDGWADLITLDMVAEDNYGIKTSMSGMDEEKFWNAVDNGFHYQYMFNTLQLNNGHNHFSDIAQMAGVTNTDWSWAPLLADFDNDGFKDLFISNGLKRDFRNNDYRNYKIKRLEAAEREHVGSKASLIRELVSLTPKRKKANYIFRNEGNLTFSKKVKAWGFEQKTFSNGATYADLDNDGDLDLVVNNVDEEPTIYRNNTRSKSNKHFISISFQGPSTNMNGIGAKIILKAGGQMQVQENFPTRGYQSSVDHCLHFGLGGTKTIDELLIIWPDARFERIHDIPTNQKLTVSYANATGKFNYALLKKDPSNHLFTDHTEQSKVNFQHRENGYNDFAKESLLPHKMSQFGPALAVGDINRDGADDFYIGGAHGYAGGLWLQNTDGTFAKSNATLWTAERHFEDLDATFFDLENDGDLDLYVVSGGNEFDAGDSLYQDRIYINDGQGNFSRAYAALPNIKSSGSVVRPFDYDGDGDQDLFIGERLVPAKYPFPTDSYLLRNDSGIFTDITPEHAPGLLGLGMVTDATWADYDQDEDPDLIVVGEWMPITIFENSGSQLVKVNPEGLKNSTGWWFSLASDDIDNDGDLDFVAGNLGLNYKYKATAAEPFEVYAHDFDENGTMDIVLGYHNQGTLFPLRGRECSSNQMPFIKEKFPTYNAFASADLHQVYGAGNLEQALHYQAKTFASAIIYNEGNGIFRVAPMPQLAQMSSVNTILIDDFNNDSISDLLIAGNLYVSEVETPRNDAGYGLLLSGDGAGNFTALNYQDTGLAIYGDVKKMKTIGLPGAKNRGIIVAKNNDHVQVLKLKSGRK